jgi:Tol biopolymer transport system component
VTWQAQPVEEPNVWDIFYHHIPTGITERLHRSTMYLFSSDVSGSNLLWNESDGTAYNVYLRRLDSGTTEKVTDSQYDQIVHTVGQEHLAFVFDYERSGLSFPSQDYDLWIYDLDTNEARRLTNTTARWGTLEPSCRWVVYLEAWGDDRGVAYAWDAVAAGVLDADCHVIPCDPQVETCAMIEWRGP